MPVSIEQRTRRKNASGSLGRRAVLWAVGLSILSQVALALGIPLDGFLIRDPIRHDRLRMLHQRMAEVSSPPKVVILLGSSHIKDGLRSRQLSLEVSAALGRPIVVSNQAMAGGGPVRSLLAMDRLIREGITPDLVLLETFPLWFDGLHDYDIGVEALPFNSLDAGDVELLRRYAVHRTDLTEQRYSDAVAPVYHQRSNLTNFLTPWLLAPDRRIRKLPEEFEFTYEDLSPERRAKAVALAKEAFSHRLQKLSCCDLGQVTAVDELVERLRARGTKVVLLATPESPTFRSWYPPDRWAKSVAWLRDLAARHGVPLIDAREWTDDEDLFCDSHHLTKASSVQFSRWLGREVLVPQLKAEE